MLRTALKPRWIGFLILTLVVTVIFAGLSKWQIDQSMANYTPPRAQTEKVVELTDHLTPEVPLADTQADQMVELTGPIDVGRSVLVTDRRRDEVMGNWWVAPVAVEGAPDGEIMPVVWGWSEEPIEATPEELEELFAESTGVAADEQLTSTGRVIPTEGSLPDTDFGTQPITMHTLSGAWLTNLWDEPIYTGAVVVEEFELNGTVHTLDESSEIKQVSVGPPPEETEVVWLNLFYGVEWAFFGGFSLYLWWRFVRDDYLKDRREAELDELWEKHWQAKELQRLRDEAARAKAEAEAAYAAYYGQQPGDDTERKD